jgi:DNA-binding GntR family transcriptional regulator
VRPQQALDAAPAPDDPEALADGAPLVDRLASAIQARVLSGAFARGARLPQNTLAAEFGVSRTPVREALRKLQATGLVEVVPNRGALVRGPTARDIREAYVVRAELEGLAAELAAGKISDRDLQRLREAEALFRRSVAALIARRRRRRGEPRWADESTWVQANDLFHQAIFDAAANDRLSAAIADIHRTFPRDLTWSALAGNSGLLEENVEQHAVILQAIERRDAAEARRLMVVHVRRAGELVSLHFEQASADASD